MCILNTKRSSFIKKTKPLPSIGHQRSFQNTVNALEDR